MVWEGPPREETSGPPRLVLHFDVNKTLIMCDPVKGVNCALHPHAPPPP